jgi:hypothetical protein
MPWLDGPAIWDMESHPPADKPTSRVQGDGAPSVSRDTNSDVVGLEVLDSPYTTDVGSIRPTRATLWRSLTGDDPSHVSAMECIYPGLRLPSKPEGEGQLLVFSF